MFIFKPKKLSHHFLSSYIYFPFFILPFSPSVFAQTVHEEKLDTIDIFSPSFFSASELQFSNQLTLDTENLNHSLISQRSNNLADTLTHISGVQNNSFGPNNGMVQIRSLTNTRVAINEDGTTTSNLAAISGHLPVNINPRTLKNITIHKSSAAVLYGGNAIGGAVTSESSTIPKVLPEKKLSGEVEFTSGSNTPNTQFVKLDGKKGRFSWHIDAMNSEISYYKSIGNPKANACYDTKNIHRMTIDKDGNELGVGRNDALMVQCQLQPIYSENKFNIHSRPLMNKEYFAALQNNNVQAYFDKYGLDSGSLKDLYRDPAKLPKWNLGDNTNLVYKTPAQFKALPPEQQKFIIDQKWGYIFIPNYNKFVMNPDYIEGSSEETQDFLGVKDIIPVKNGRIPNSHSHLKNVNIGGSYIEDNGYIGISAHHYKNDYGVPGFAQFMTATGDAYYLEPVNIKSEQNKIQFEGSHIIKHPILKNISLKLAYLDSENNEYLGKHFADSLNSQQTSIRSELSHSFKKITGVVGIDYLRQKTSSKGQDRFLPNTKSDELGLFLLENINFQYLNIGLGVRKDFITRKAYFDENYQFTHNYGDRNLTKRTFSTNNAFVNLAITPTNFITLNARFNHSERAPQVNELFASGKHFAILAEETGNPNLEKENTNTYELGAAFEYENFRLEGNYYKTYFNNYIYLGNTGLSQNLLDRKKYRQSDSIIKGFEIELNSHFVLGKYGELDLRLFTDLVKNSPKDQNTFRTYQDGKTMPNLPTSRYGIGLSYQKDKLKIGSSFTRYMPQKYKSGLSWEVDLPDYNLVDLYSSYDIDFKTGNKLQIFSKINNLTNEKAHPNNSTLKYITPLPSRQIKVGLRYIF